MEQVKMTSHSLGRKTLAQLFEEAVAVEVEAVLVHQAFAIPNAGMESSINKTRTPLIKMRKHPGYGYICEHKGKWFLIEETNVVFAQ